MKVSIDLVFSSWDGGFGVGCASVLGCASMSMTMVVLDGERSMRRDMLKTVGRLSSGETCSFKEGGPCFFVSDLCVPDEMNDRRYISRLNGRL